MAERLPEEHKVFLITNAAMFLGPTRVAKMFAEQFPGETVTPQQCYNWDASKPYSRARMTDEDVKLFDDTRQAYRDRVKDIPIANQVYRLQVYQDLLDAQLEKRTVPAFVVKELLEAAAKDEGGGFTNAKIIKGDPNEPVTFTVEMGRELTPK